MPCRGTALDVPDARVDSGRSRGSYTETIEAWKDVVPATRPYGRTASG